MSLPKLEIPTFETTQPSTGKKIKFRPFLVKEHKTLLMVRDTSDSEITRIMKEIVDVCTFNKLKINDLPSFDIEFLFAKIRSKSIGEVVDLIVNCKKCNHKNSFKMNLDELQVFTDPDHQSKFMINDQIGIEMRYPSFSINLYTLIEEGIEKYFEEIQKYLKSVYTTDGKYFEIASADKEEVDDFISCMTSDQFTKIEDFFLTMPRLLHKQDVKCEKCEEINKVKVEGLSNFFV